MTTFRLPHRGTSCTLENLWEPTMTLYTAEGGYALCDLDLDLELKGTFVPADESVGAGEGVEDVEIVGTPHFWDAAGISRELPSDLLPYLNRWFAQRAVQELAASRLLDNFPERDPDAERESWQEDHFND